MAIIKLSRQTDLLVEAETLAREAGSPWSVVTDPDVSGRALLALAGSSLPAAARPETTSPGHLALQLDVATPGTYYLSLRGLATGELPHGASFAIGLDGKPLPGTAGIAGFDHGDSWSETPLRIDITTAGLHSIDLWPQQPGLALDSLYLSTSAAIEPGLRQARSVSSFVDSIGVNTHLTWLDSRYADLDAVKSALLYLGIHNVRDTLSNAAAADRFDQLGDLGVKMDWLLSPVSESAPPGQALEWGLQQIRAHAWMTRFIEGPNEVDFWPVARSGLTGTEGAAAFQRDLYALAKADGLLARFPVLQHTLGDYANYAGQQDMSAYADLGNVHSYTGDSDAPGDGIDFALRTQETLNGADPVVTTETGYGTSSAQSYGRVSELTQAKYIPRLLAEQYAQGIEATYLYQLFDPYAGADPSGDFFNYYGLYRADGSAKPAAEALHRLTTWLGDNGKSYTPGTLDYTLRDAPDSLGSVLLQKSNGTFVLMLWNDVKSFNADTGADMVTAPASIQIDFQGQPQKLVLRDTLTGGSTTVATGLHVALKVPDHVVLLEISGVPGATGPTALAAPAAQSVPGPAPLTTTVGTGSDTLVLHLSQDYWRGSAQYTVSVDGVKVGGTQTARAFHSDGLSDTLTLHGEWGVGQHTVSVAFVNDAYGGSASADRNLYLGAVSYNGVTVAGARSGSIATTSFAVTDSTAKAAAPMVMTLGTGTDALVLKLAQDAWQGNAQYTVSVDGVQIGGVQTASASYASGQSDTLTLRGDWALGAHSVALRFTNDAYGGSPSADRNLYLLDATYNGVAVGTNARGHVGTTSFGVIDTAPAPAAFTFGSGGDALVLKVSQDAWQQNAQYTVAVDGQQIGGTLTASAYHAVGQSDTITVRGDWAVGQHTVTLRFLNDAAGTGAGQDRNLYLDAATYNGQHVTAGYGSIGVASFQVTDQPPPAKTAVIGTGTDSLVLRIAQDAWQGDAQFTVSVDGVQLGGVQTAAAYRSAGVADTLTFQGDWALGAHTVCIAFLNDAGGSVAGADRNLYLLDATYNGVAVGQAARGTVTVANFAVTDVAPAPANLTLGAGPDALVLKFSQDAWQGNAQYTVAVDGQQIGGVQTAAAYRAAGQSDTITLRGDWAVGQHAVTVTFVNDAYGGSPARDRNLYLDDATYDGRHIETYHGAIDTASFAVTDTGVWG